MARFGSSAGGKGGGFQRGGLQRTSWNSTTRTSSSSSYGGKRGGQSRWSHRRRLWRGMGSAGGYSQWASGIQACLGQLVGPWVPQNGIIGPRTRRAVQIFQQQQQLPVTGLLDSATIAALQSACSAPPSAASQAPEPAPPPTAPDSTPAAAGPPEQAAPSDAGTPPSAGEAEISENELEFEAHETLQVGGPCKCEVEQHAPVAFTRDPNFQWAPDSPAVYVTFVDGKPWHVGIAEQNLRCHLLQRARALKDLNIPSTTLQNRSIGWITVRSGAAPRCAIRQASAAGGGKSFHPVPVRHGIFKVLKQFLIRKLQTANKGNPGMKTVQFNPSGSFTITEKGKTITELSAKKPL